MRIRDRILELLTDPNGKTALELAEALGLSRHHVQVDLAKLMRMGEVVRVEGRSPNGRAQFIYGLTHQPPAAPAPPEGPKSRAPKRHTFAITRAQIDAVAAFICDGPVTADAEGWSRILRCGTRSVPGLLTAAVRADVCRVDRIRAVGGDVWRVRPVPADPSQPRRVDVREEAV